MKVAQRCAQYPVHPIRRAPNTAGPLFTVTTLVCPVVEESLANSTHLEFGLIPTQPKPGGTVTVDPYPPFPFAALPETLKS